MPQIGWLDPSSGQELSFEDALAEAEAYGTWAELPYEVLMGIYRQLDKSDRPNGITVTQLNGCARSAYLDAKLDYYSEPLQNYPAFRGTLAHAMLEKFKPAGAIIEERYFRSYKSIELSGQIDSWRIMGVDDQVSKDWHEWLRHVEHTETVTKGYQDKPVDPYSVDECEARSNGTPCPGRAQPALPKTARLLIRDWKTKKDVPTYTYVANRYQNQGNIYAWLLRWPHKDRLDIEFVFVAMDAVKTQSLMNGGKFSNGRAKPEQLWSQYQLEKFFDDRLLTLAASKKYDKPLPYDRVPDEDLWNCAYCPAIRLCHRLAAEEAFKSFKKGEVPDRMPPRLKAKK